MIDFIIAVRDRENERIQRCIDSFKKYANSITVVDYGSKTPIKVRDAKIIRYVKSKIWNKSHALNLGIKNTNSEYICTVDCDMILNEPLLDEMVKNLNENNVIFNTNVRRLELKNLNEDYLEMIKKSKPWFQQGSRGNVYSAANGGIQCFSRKWIYEVGGYDEGLGLYWGAMDNRIYEQAKMSGKTIIDLNITMLHQEHTKQKESNLEVSEMAFANHVRAFKVDYLNDLIRQGIYISNREWGGELPNHNWLIKLVKEWEEKLIPPAKILIALITNYQQVPTYFMMDVLSMIGLAKQYGVECAVFSMKGAGIDELRNNAVEYAKNEGCTHILQLDTDHHYPNETILKLLSHDKDFVCGVTTKRVPPFSYTQFKDYKKIPINTQENECKFSEDVGVVKIGSTGMVGSLIKMNVFNKVEKPYYEFKRIKVEDKEYVSGEDVVFCRKLNESGIDIWCDTSLSYPHQIATAFADRGKILIE